MLCSPLSSSAYFFLVSSLLVFLFIVLLALVSSVWMGAVFFYKALQYISPVYTEDIYLNQRLGSVSRIVSPLAVC